MSRPGLGMRVVTALARAYATADQRVRTVQTLAEGCVQGVLDEALATAEKSELGIRIYDQMYRDRDPGRLFDWERAWFERELPPPPARIFLPAAGAGREARALCELGYRVDAQEPAPRPARHCARVVGDRGHVAVASFDDLTRAVLDGEGDAAPPIDRYDAVVLGWGSLGHVLDRDHRRRLLRACDRLTPTGPILASFWLESGRPAGRAERWGRGAGRALRRLRGLSDLDAPLQFRPWCGFVQTLTPDDVDELAASIGRRARWGSRPGQAEYPHVTLHRA